MYRMFLSETAWAPSVTRHTGDPQYEADRFFKCLNRAMRGLLKRRIKPPPLYLGGAEDPSACGRRPALAAVRLIEPRIASRAGQCGVPRQLCKWRLHNCAVRPAGRERPHVLEVSGEYRRDSGKRSRRSEERRLVTRVPHPQHLAVAGCSDAFSDLIVGVSSGSRDVVVPLKVLAWV